MLGAMDSTRFTSARSSYWLNSKLEDLVNKGGDIGGKDDSEGYA